MNVSFQDKAIKFLQELSRGRDLLSRCKKKSARIVDIARERGYMMTERAFRDVLIKVKKQRGDQLSEAQLESVAGGVGETVPALDGLSDEALDLFHSEWSNG